MYSKRDRDILYPAIPSIRPDDARYTLGIFLGYKGYIPYLRPLYSRHYTQDIKGILAFILSTVYPTVYRLYLVQHTYLTYLYIDILHIWMTDLWSLPSLIRNEARIRVILDIFAFDIMFQMIQRAIRTIRKFQYRYLHDVDLKIDNC